MWVALSGKADGSVFPAAIGGVGNLIVATANGDHGMTSRADERSAAPEPHVEPRLPRSKALRWAINLALALHLLAIIIAPAAVSPSSDLVQAGWDLFHPYLQMLYLNHGYHFFAPEPGDSTLLAFHAERTDGTVVSGRIPNRQIVPRLLYHRHFMLTEQMKDAPEELRDQWLGSYAEHICRKYGAARVRLTGQTHHLPTMEMVRAGVRLDDPSSYEDEDLGVFECETH
jgi:hypothetical protein